MSVTDEELRAAGSYRHAHVLALASRLLTATEEGNEARGAGSPEGRDGRRNRPSRSIGGHYNLKRTEGVGRGASASLRPRP